MSYRKLFYLTRKLTVKKDSTQSAQYWHPQLPAKYLLQITRNKNTYAGTPGLCMERRVALYRACTSTRFETSGFLEVRKI